MPDPQPRLTDVSGPTGAATDDTADQPAEPAHLRIVPWRDEVIDRVGHDPRSGYVERFWLGVLGPSTTLLLRRFAAELDHEPEGFELDLDETARRLGLGDKRGRHSPFVRAIGRSCQFRMAQRIGPHTLAVRRRLPPLSRGQVLRLSPRLQSEHAQWQEEQLTADEPTTDLERARGVALSLLAMGEDAESIEWHLHRWRFPPALSSNAARWAADHGPGGDAA